MWSDVEKEESEAQDARVVAVAGRGLRGVVDALFGPGQFLQQIVKLSSVVTTKGARDSSFGSYVSPRAYQFLGKRGLLR